jgi:hypothetical protein
MNTHKLVALVLVRPDAGQLGHPRKLDHLLADDTVLHHTLRRVSAIPGIDEVHCVGHDGDDTTWAASIRQAFPDIVVPTDPDDADGSTSDGGGARRRRVRRAWSTAAWRGGFRGATVWDELTPLGVLLRAAERAEADAVLLVGGDWCVIDPNLCEALLQKHREAPEAMPLCFSQAPPGLSGLVVSTTLLRNVAASSIGFAELLAYNPRRPVLDPISQDFCLPVPPEVRGTARRFIFDTPDARRRLNRIADDLGNAAFADADATTITAACRAHALPSLREGPGGGESGEWPPILEIELTPQRIARGPVTPQHDATFDRAPLDLALLRNIGENLAGRAVTLGGIGEPLLHPRWAEAVTICRDAGAAAVALQTDLLTENENEPEALAEAIVAADPDAVFVRLNAETAATYAEAMGVDRFAEVLGTLQALFRGRAARIDGEAMFPLIVPALTKTVTTTPEMDVFFERWWQLADHVVLHRFPQGGRGPRALAPDRNPVPMDPPWRTPDPGQRKHRLTVLSDGRVTLCHEDWHGRAALGDLHEQTLDHIWRTGFERLSLEASRHDDSPFCPRCFGYAMQRVGDLVPV